MSQDKLYTNLINALDEKELYHFAKIYLKEVDGLKKLAVTNGPYDSGIDIVDLNGIEIQYQATVEKRNFESKIESDLAKAKDNHDKYGLPNKVKYFYSQNLSGKSILDYKKLAKQKYGLTLDLLDANLLSEVADVFDELSDLLLNSVGFEKYKKRSDFFDNPKAKAFYDLMSFGKSTDVKYSIVKSFVLNHLCGVEQIDENTLLNEINQHFGSKISKDYFQNFLRKLSAEKKITYRPTVIRIDDDEKKRIQSLLADFKREEAVLIKELSDILETYKVSAITNDVIVRLSELYQSSYSINLGEFTSRESNVRDVETANNALYKILKENSPSETDVNKIIKLLINASDNREILPRIAAGQVYTKVSDPDRLQQYIWQNINNKTIFLDANFLIYLLLVHYDESISFEDYYFRLAKQFLNFARDNDLSLMTIRRYAIETTNIFKDAVSIIPFSKLPVFDFLGGSSNIVYKFYLHLKDNHLLQSEIDNYEKFLSEFKFQLRNGRDNFRSSMEFLLTSSGIEIEEIEDYPLGKTIQLIEDDQRRFRRSKSFTAIQNDAIMFMRLGDKESEVNPLDPIFCTFDLSLMNVRKAYFESFPDCTKWFMFTPARLMDHFAMMNFQVKPGTVSNELLSILDHDDNFQNATQSLLDSMVLIINPQNEAGLRFTNKLGEMRNKDILEFDYKNELPDPGNETTPTDKVISSLIKNYFFSSDQTKTEAFQQIFTKTELVDEFLSVVEEEKKIVKSTGNISNELIIKMDKMIEKSNSKK